MSIVVVSGAKGSWGELMAEKLRSYFGLKEIFNEWHGEEIIKDGGLVLTSIKPEAVNELTSNLHANKIHIIGIQTASTLLSGRLSWPDVLGVAKNHKSRSQRKAKD